MKKPNHNGKKNFIVKGYKILLTLVSGFYIYQLGNPLILKFYSILSLTSDDPWNPESINDYDQGGIKCDSTRLSDWEKS